MKILSGSLSYHAARRSSLWLEAATRHSVTGRFFLGLVRVSRRVAGDSGTLGTRHVGTRKLARTGHPLSVLVISRPYIRLRNALGGGMVGRVTKTGGAQAARSRFVGGAWILAVGSGLFALGCGRLALLLARGISTVDNTGLALATPGLRLITPIVVLCAGALIVANGPRLLPAFRASLVGRGVGHVTGGWPGGPRDTTWSWGLVAGPVGVGALLAAGAGAVAGLTSGSGAVALVAIVVALSLLALVLVRPEAMLLAVAAFPWIDWVARRTLGVVGPAWDDALLLFSIGLLLWCVIATRRWELWTVPITLPTLLALAAAIGSIVVRDVPGDVALFAMRILFQPLLFYFLGFLFPKNKTWVQGAVFVFVLASVALALHGLYQYVTSAPMPASWVDVRETGIATRAYSIIENPNGLGAFLLMGTMVSLSLALARGLRRLPRLLWAAACVVQLGGLAVTFSRGAWIGLAAGIVALLVMAYRHYLIPLVGVAVVGWFVVPRAFIDRLTFAFSSAYLTKSMEAGRLYVWKMAADYVAAHPWFGLGLGTFGGTSAVTFAYGRLWVDSFYLQLGAEGGLILLALFLWILLRGAKGLVKGYGMTGDPYLRALAAGALGAFAAVAVANLTASVWETLAVGVGFWFLTGLATSAAMQVGADAAESPEEAR
ncbi:MAG: hypothetical protein A2133_11310 [Actinobacteria bacterium RBG_16_64_13]|nr:MAG: hypothetical protein A2133_11310 [Actinobacteria bacterium RBG_16_64_13]